MTDEENISLHFRQDYGPHFWEVYGPGMCPRLYFNTDPKAKVLLRMNLGHLGMLHFDSNRTSHVVVS